LRRSLWGLALEGNPAANIFLAKNLLGYTDYIRNEHAAGPTLQEITEIMNKDEPESRPTIESTAYLLA